MGNFRGSAIEWLTRHKVLPTVYNGVYINTLRDLSGVVGKDKDFIMDWVTEEPIITSIDKMIELFRYIDWLDSQPWTRPISRSIVKLECFTNQDNDDHKKFPQTVNGVRYLSSSHVEYTFGLKKKYFGAYLNYHGTVKESILAIINTIETRENSFKLIDRISALAKVTGVSIPTVRSWLRCDNGRYINTDEDFKRLADFKRTAIGSFGSVEELILSCFSDSNPDKTRFPQTYKGVKIYSIDQMKSVFNIKTLNLSKFKSIFDAAEYCDVLRLYGVSIKSWQCREVYRSFPLKNGCTFSDFLNKIEGKPKSMHLTFTCESLMQEFNRSNKCLSKVIEDFTISGKLPIKRSTDNLKKKLSKDERYLPLNVRKSSCFWLCDTLFISSVSSGCEKFCIPKFSFSSENRELEFIQHYIKYCVKENNGVIIENLIVQEEVYPELYRCLNNNECAYLSGSEIMLKRLSYYKIADSANHLMGIYSSKEDLLSFYNIKTVLSKGKLDIEMILRLSKKYPVCRKENGYATLKELRDCYVKTGRAKESYLNQVLAGTQPYSPLGNSNGSITLRYPVVNKDGDIVYKKRIFLNRAQASKELLGYSVKLGDGSDESFERCLEKALLRRYNSPVMYGRKFKSISEMWHFIGFKSLSNTSSWGINADTPISRIKEIFERKIFSKKSTPELNERLGISNLEIRDFSFYEDSSGLSYYKVLFKDEGKVRVVSSAKLLELMFKYKGGEYIAEE